MVVEGARARRVKKITPKLCGRRWTKSTVSRLTEDLDPQAGLGRAPTLAGQRQGTTRSVLFDAMHIQVGWVPNFLYQQAG
jgi:hypothetical protein